MPTQPTPRVCPHCAASIVPHAPQGLCPACLFAEPGESWMEKPSGLTDAEATIRFDTEATSEAAPATIGHYRIMEKLGEGGFGVVYRAEQTAPIRREVALKVIKPGMESAEVIQRFEAERQTLAQMEHPNIAAVLDAGTMENGRPYFVMELVRGQPVTIYCDERRLDIRRRLELFIPVCRAVGHAHQKAILHRDLKPSNILVTEVDEAAVPKVIDFGIAKALGTSGTEVREELLHTMVGMIMGTPQYMSPEQAGAAADIDTRSDIYTLGGILYELLTGQTPVSRESLRNAAFDEALRLIREAEPVRPSDRVVPATGVTRAISSSRRTEPPRLQRILRGDLDWITLKALEKERERRYGTAAALADDLERYLANEPVTAGPPSALYRLRKLARRHRLAFTATTVILLLLAAGISVSVWQWRKARTSLHQFLSSGIEETMQRGDFAKALTLLDEAGRAGHPDKDDLVFKRIEVLEALGDPLVPDLIRSLDPASLHPRQRPRLVFWKADRMLATGVYDEAMPLLKRATEAGLPPVEDALARAAMSSTVSEAIGFYEAAAARAPWRMVAQRNLTMALILSGRADEARTRLRLCHLLFPDDAGLYIIEAFLEVFQGNASKAVTILNSTRSDEGNAPAIHLLQKVAGPMASNFRDIIAAASCGATNPETSVLDNLLMLKAFADFTAESGFSQKRSSAAVGKSAPLPDAVNAVLGSSIPSGELDTASLELLQVMNIDSPLINRGMTGFARALVRYGGSDPQGAASGLQETLRSFDEGSLWMLLGSLEFQLSHFEKSVEAARKAQLSGALLPGVAQGACMIEGHAEFELWFRTKDAGCLERSAAAFRRGYRSGDLPLGAVNPLALRVALQAGDRFLAHQVLDRFPKGTAEQWEHQARVEYAEGNAAGALQSVEKAVRLAPKNGGLKELCEKMRDRQLAGPSLTGEPIRAANLSVEGTGDCVGCLTVPGGMSLMLGLNGTTLTVASWSKDNGDKANDHLILLSDSLHEAATENPQWGKTGLSAIPAQMPFLGGESTTSYVGWQQIPDGTATTASKVDNDSGQLKGSLDLAKAFGKMPATLFISATAYTTQDRGGVSAQCPAGNGDNKLDPDEFFAFPLTAFGAKTGNGAGSGQIDPQIHFRVYQETPGDPVTLTLTLPNVPGKPYQIESSGDLTEWHAWTGPPTAVPGAMPSITINLTGSEMTKRFYRARP